jgi:hypothetical protein
VRQAIPQQPAYCLVVADDRNIPAEEEGVVRNKVDRRYDEIVVPVRCLLEFGGRGTTVDIHDINTMACICIGTADLFSAVDCIQHQNMHIKKSEK